MVLTLVEGGGRARSFHVEPGDAASIISIVSANVAAEATIATDGAAYYKPLRRMGYDHKSVRHALEAWVRGEVHSTSRSYFPVFKRGMRGVYRHCNERHLHRYVAEFDFRYNNRVTLGVNDEQRAGKLVEGAVGKRLSYRTTDKEEEAAEIDDAPVDVGDVVRHLRRRWRRRATPCGPGDEVRTARSAYP